MPALPLSSDALSSGGDLPVDSAEDVLRALPDRVTRELVAPVRDALVEAEREMFTAYQAAASYAAAQSDPTQATGRYLDEFAGEVSIFRQEGEENEPLRDRLFSVPAIITPNAIKAAVDALLAPFTHTHCILWESVLDRMFLGDGSTDVVRSFLGDGLEDMTPSYPDRRYELRGNCSPGGPQPLDDGYGREFIIRIPDLAAPAAIAAFLGDGTTLVSASYVADGTEVVDDMTYLFPGANSADATYAQIVNTVEQMRGHGVRWVLWVDPKLAA